MELSQKALTPFLLGPDAGTVTPTHERRTASNGVPPQRESIPGKFQGAQDIRVVIGP
jgi:hypothetical protein